MKCDGLWKGDDGTTCESKIALTCDCRRCSREDEDEKFHACADTAHQRKASARHERVRDRMAFWRSV
jgi:hypothetical protein